MLKKVLIGNGNAARIHYQTMPEVEVVGVVDTDPKKAIEGIPYFKTIDEMVEKKINTDYFDICSPTEYHIENLHRILESDPEAKILVEKPICQPSQLEETRKLAKKFDKAKVAVNENYVSSNVTQTVHELLRKYEMKNPYIQVEFSKNRISDVERGRFLDKELLAAGYELPHQMSVVCADDGKKMKKLITSKLTPMILTDGQEKYGQGSIDFTYVSTDGSIVNMFSSMDGNKKVALPAIEEIPSIDIKESSQRYRVFKAVNDGKMVIGLFEPITGLQRNIGKVFAFDGDSRIEKAVVEDNSMKTHQKRAVRFFEDISVNPCDIITSADIVEDLNRAVMLARKQN